VTAVSARLAAPLAAAMLAGCAGQLNRPPAGFYRVPGLASTPTPLSPVEGAQSFRLELGGGQVEAIVEAELEGGDLVLVTAVRNEGRGKVRYDLLQAAVADADGTALEPLSVGEDPSRRPSAAERAGEPYRAGWRQIARGERLVVTRRFRPSPDAEPRLERLELADEVEIEGQAQPLRLRLEKVR
jgi:hypothetical protein